MISSSNYRQTEQRQCKLLLLLMMLMPLAVAADAVSGLNSN